MAAQMSLEIGIKGWKHGHNINEIEVPPQLDKVIPTGIKWFDDVLGGQGGMTPSTSMIFTGTPGAGKTTFCLQLANSLTKMGHVALFNTGEESLYQVRKVTRRIKLEQGFIAGQDTDVTKAIAHMDLLRKANPKKQLFGIFDSLQTMDDGKYSDGAINSMTNVRVTHMLTEYAKTNFAIIIIIGQVCKDGKFAGKNQIKHAVDVHGHLFVDTDKKSETFGERIFQVEKNRFGASQMAYIVGMNDKGLFEKGHFEWASSV
jgi:DNA repair protein RadA/Sms